MPRPTKVRSVRRRARQAAELGLRSDPSPVNRTQLALLSRGFDSDTARTLWEKGWTLAKLQQASVRALKKLKFSDAQIKEVRNARRAEVPFQHLIRVLSANRFTCCVCHDVSRPVIVHHIEEWSDSHSHDPTNLAVLCLEHHDRAHSVSELTRNLDKRTLVGLKKGWEQEVARTNTEAVLNASRTNYDAWWYFNHLRLFELANALRISLIHLDGFHGARSQGLVNDDGGLARRSPSLRYMYSGGEGMSLYRYVRNVMNAVLGRLTVLNISDYLDKGYLAPTLSRGDFIYAQGLFTFTPIKRIKKGHGQTCRGKRKANNVEVSFLFDRWEATSNSAWAGWLSGRHVAGSILRVVNLQRKANLLEITGTVFGICTALEGLKKREYATFPYRHGVYIDYGEDLEDVPED